MKTTLLLALFCLLYGVTASAQIYKWVDDKGEVHYQDHPRGKVAGISMDESGSKVESNEVKKLKTNKLLKDMERARKKREKSRKKQQAKQEKLDEKCLKARSKLRKIQAKMDKKYSEFSNDRPISYYRDAAELADRKKYIDKYCN